MIISLRTLLTSLAFASALTACGVEDPASETKALADCGTEDGASCLTTTRGSANVKIYNYSQESLAQKQGAGTRLENGKLFVYAPEVTVANIKAVARGEVKISLPIEYTEIQTRHQEWKRCGRLGVERCRRWIDDGRTPIDASVEIWINGVRSEPATYNSAGAAPGGWSEDWNTIQTFLGPINVIADGGDVFGFASSLASTVLGGRQLKNAWRNFSGSTRVERSMSFDQSGSIADVKVVVRRNRSSGSLAVQPFTLEVVNY